MRKNEGKPERNSYALIQNGLEHIGESNILFSTDKLKLLTIPRNFINFLLRG